MSSGSRSKRQGITLEETRRFGYGSCDTHKPYKTRTEAKRATRVHWERKWHSCLKCLAGMIIHPFRCTTNSRHWHIGHAWRNSRPKSSGND